MSTAIAQQSGPGGAPAGAGQASDRFVSLCASLEEYEHLPELTPGGTSSRAVGEQSESDTLAESILAGLTQP